jgi:hypothetical protein
MGVTESEKLAPASQAAAYLLTCYGRMKTSLNLPTAILKD